VGFPQPRSRLRAPPLPAQPFAVEQVSAGELGSDADPAEVPDRLLVKAVRLLAVGEQGV